MKKSIKLLSLISAAFLVIMLSSCELFNRAKELVGPTNQWRRYEYDYELQGGNKVRLLCYLMYSDGYTNSEMKLPDDDRFPGGKLQKGLTLVIVPKSDAEGSLVQQLFGVAMDKKYVIKTFKEGESVAMNEGSGEDKSFKMGFTTWAVIYNSIHTESCSLPTAINRDENYAELTDLSSFNFKKLMAGMALNYLTDYLED